MSHYKFYKLLTVLASWLVNLLYDNYWSSRHGYMNPDVQRESTKRNDELRRYQTFGLTKEETSVRMTQHEFLKKSYPDTNEDPFYPVTKG